MEKFEKYHWEFINQGDHIDVYETRAGDVIGGFYSPEAPFTMEEIVEKTADMSEQDVFDFIEEYIEWY